MFLLVWISGRKRFRGFHLVLPTIIVLYPQVRDAMGEILKHSECAFHLYIQRWERTMVWVCGPPLTHYEMGITFWIRVCISWYCRKLSWLEVSTFKPYNFIPEYPWPQTFKPIPKKSMWIKYTTRRAYTFLCTCPKDLLLKAIMSFMLTFAFTASTTLTLGTGLCQEGLHDLQDDLELHRGSSCGFSLQSLLTSINHQARYSSWLFCHTHHTWLCCRL